MNHLNKTKSKGFTLIELMLAMTFLSMLLLAIALTIVQIATIYNRGLTAKDINAASRDISTELNLALTSSSNFSLNAADHHYVQTSDGGRLCVGEYSYIWNYAGALSTPSPTRNMYLSTGQPDLSANIVKSGSTTRYEISLVKAPDADGSYCVQSGTTGAYPDVNPTGATELLRTGDYGIVLYDLEVTTASTATDALSGQELYKITYVLGTPNVSAMDGTKDTTTCKAPNETNADTDYCSAEEFTLVVRVVNGVN